MLRHWLVPVFAILLALVATNAGASDVVRVGGATNDDPNANILGNDEEFIAYRGGAVRGGAGFHGGAGFRPAFTGSYRSFYSGVGHVGFRPGFGGFHRPWVGVGVGIGWGGRWGGSGWGWNNVGWNSWGRPWGWNTWGVRPWGWTSWGGSPWGGNNWGGGSWGGGNWTGGYIVDSFQNNGFANPGCYMMPSTPYYADPYGGGVPAMPYAPVPGAPYAPQSPMQPIPEPLPRPRAIDGVISTNYVYFYPYDGGPISPIPMPSGAAAAPAEGRFIAVPEQPKTGTRFAYPAYGDPGTTLKTSGFSTLP